MQSSDVDLKLTNADLGKKFRRRDGEVNTLRRSTHRLCPFSTSEHALLTYYPTGRWCKTNIDYRDLVERVDDVPAPCPAKPQDVLRTLPSTAGERKTLPIMTGVLDYFPLAISEVARISKAGNDQHNPGQPLHWARGKSLDHVDCIGRHLIERGDIDTDGMRHTAKAAWRALALLQEEMEAEAKWKPAGASIPSVTPLTSQKLVASSVRDSGWSN